MWSFTKPNSPAHRLMLAACVLPILISLAACEKKPEAAADTPAPTDSAAVAAATTTAAIDYGYLGAPDASDSDDPGSAKRTPEKSLALFRKTEANPAQGTPDHPIDNEALKTNAEVQRVRFYAAAKALPQLVTPQDWKLVRAEEAFLISDMCAMQDGDTAVSAADKVPKQTCDAANAASAQGAK